MTCDLNTDTDASEFSSPSLEGVSSIVPSFGVQYYEMREHRNQPWSGIAHTETLPCHEHDD
jgi:hypothetical protein